MDIEHIPQLMSCHLFEGITRQEIRELLEPRRCQLKEYHEGAMVAFRGDSYTSLWIVLQGRLAAEFQDYRGRVLRVESLSEGDPIAAAILFAPETNFPVTLIAETDVRLCVIPRREVLRIMQTSEQFLLNYLRDNGSKIAFLAEKLRLVQFSTIREKIASYLLDLAEKQATDSPVLSISKEELSEIFGVSRPSLSREFSRLVEEEIISRDGRQVHIMQRETLETILDAY